jgi:hypothetical protein
MMRCKQRYCYRCAVAATSLDQGRCVSCACGDESCTSLTLRDNVAEELLRTFELLDEELLRCKNAAEQKLDADGRQLTTTGPA